jgi:hypothetical protein
VVILVRQKVGGVLTDLTAYARFLDRLELEEDQGNWRITERTAIYERDRLDPVEPSESFERLFASTDLSAYPEAYRYMATRPGVRSRPSSTATARPIRSSSTGAIRRGSKGSSPD